MSQPLGRLVADNLDIWTSATLRKSGAGRGGGKRISLYGIERLRALILDLAVRGKLVPQDAGDEPPSELLKRIAKERAEEGQKVKGGKIADGGNGTSRPSASIPSGWIYVPLAEILLGNVGGGTPSKTDSRYWGGEIPWASVKDVGKSKYVSDTQDRITQLGLDKSSSNLVPAGNIILVTRMGLGQLSINTIDLAINQDLRAIFISKYINIDYCYNFFLTHDFEGSGMTVKGVKLPDLLNTPFPLPPLAEQRRIVAKVDELMAHCDALERESADAMAAHTHLVVELLATLVNSASPADLAANWVRLETHFDTLFTTDASIEALKQTILDLAVRGKLVEQDAGDEAAPALLKRIKQEKTHLIAEGKIKREKPLPPLKDAEKSFSLPSGWLWSQPDEFSLKITDGEHFRPVTTSSGVYFLSAKDIRETGVSLADPLFVSQGTADKARSRCDPDFGDLLIVSRGATCGRICKVDINEVFCLLGSVILLKPSSLMNNHYLEIVLKSPRVFEALVSASGATAQGAIYLRDLKKIAIPLPPVAEQHRIVAKVDALMALCDALKARLADAAQTQRHLADAITERAAA